MEQGSFQKAMRVFLDANILFSASLPKSHLALFLEGLGEYAELLSNVYACEEAERNLATKFPGSLPVFQKLCGVIELVPVGIFDSGVGLAEKDQPILCGAIAGQADYLLTGDKKDFGHLFGKSIGGVTVVSVELLLKELIDQGVLQNP
jgi:predicted nucleic acid-binding protein